MVPCVGRTGTGADCAMVMKAGFSVDLLSRDRDKRPHAREILAMPLDKKWRWQQQGGAATISADVHTIDVM